MLEFLFVKNCTVFIFVLFPARLKEKNLSTFAFIPTNNCIINKIVIKPLDILCHVFLVQVELVILPRSIINENPPEQQNQQPPPPPPPPQNQESGDEQNEEEEQEVEYNQL